MLIRMLEKSAMRCPYFMDRYVGVCIAAARSPYVPSIIELRRFCEELDTQTCPIYRSLPIQAN